MLILAYILSTLAGTLVFWIVGRFSDDPPNIVESILGSLAFQIVSYVLSLFSLSRYLAGIVLFILLLRFARMSAIPAFLGTVLYSFAFVALGSFLFATLGIK